MWASTKEAVKTNVMKVSRTFARIRHRRLVAWWGTTSPVSFGPIGSPSVAGSVFPDRAASPPGVMSDVAGSASAGASFCAGCPPSSSGGTISSPPGLPLSDPPRVTGAYGVPAYDPDFGFATRGNAFDHQVPIPPPPPQPSKCRSERSLCSAS